MRQKSNWNFFPISYCLGTSKGQKLRNFAKTALKFRLMLISHLISIFSTYMYLHKLILKLFTTKLSLIFLLYVSPFRHKGLNLVFDKNRIFNSFCSVFILTNPHFLYIFIKNIYLEMFYLKLALYKSSLYLHSKSYGIGSTSKRISNKFENRLHWKYIKTHVNMVIFRV